MLAFREMVERRIKLPVVLWDERLTTVAADRTMEETGLRTAALSGGVFQNRLLLDLVRSELEEAGFRVLIHSLLPPNDGGIALGQAVAAMYRLQT